MNHYVYQITNNINGKIYIGKRSCKCDVADDKYFGSGIALKAAIKKYGKENFTKTVIDVCESPEMAFELEALIVDADFLKRTDIYNLVGGGIGCSSVSDIVKQKMSVSKTGENNPMFGKPGTMLNKRHTEESKQKMNSCGMTGKHHTTETILKFKEYRHTKETRIKMSLNSVNKTDKIIIDKIIEMLHSSGIDFTKFGWVGKAAIIIGITPQKVNNWMKRNMLDFYESTCFKRTISV